MVLKQGTIERKYEHYHNLEIVSRCTTLRYANLQRLSRERRKRLEESKQRFALSREMNELQHWVADKVMLLHLTNPFFIISLKVAIVTSEEVGKDLEHVEVLSKKFDEFNKELSVNESRLATISSMAEEMVQGGHSDAEDIQSEMEVCPFSSHLLTNISLLSLARILVISGMPLYSLPTLGGSILRVHMMCNCL